MSGIGQPVGASGVSDLLERVRASFEKQGLMRLLGAEVVEVGKRICTIEVPFSEAVTQTVSLSPIASANP